MAEPALNLSGVPALAKEHRGTGAAEAVKADPRSSVTATGVSTHSPSPASTAAGLSTRLARFDCRPVVRR